MAAKILSRASPTLELIGVVTASRCNDGWQDPLVEIAGEPNKDPKSYHKTHVWQRCFPPLTAQVWQEQKAGKHAADAMIRCKSTPCDYRPIMRGLLMVAFMVYFIVTVSTANVGVSNLSHVGGFTHSGMKISSSCNSRDKVFKVHR